MTPLRVLIVDDEPAARRGVRLLARKDPSVTIVGECGDGEEAIRGIERLRPDLVFLDVQIPGPDGFEVLARLNLPRMPYIIFVTAYDRYAIEAFNVHAVDYLLKPFSDHRFQEALERAKERLRAQELGELREWIRGRKGNGGSPDDESARRPGKLAVRDRDRIVLLDVDRIRWIEAQRDYAAVHADGRTWLIRRKMSELQASLDPERFVRIHRSALVNLDAVKELCPLFKGEYAVLLTDGTELRLSRRRREALAEALGQPL